MKTSFRRTVGRGSLAALIAGALTLVPALTAPAADGVDQHQDTMEVSPGSNIPFVAQTFTAGVSGQLDRVSIGSRKSSTSILRVSLRDVDPGTGKPMAANLASSAQDTGTWSQQFRDFAFSPTVTIAAGHRYAIVAQTGANFFWYYSSNPDSYRDGQLWECASVCSSWVSDRVAMDLAFKTWVIGAPTVNVPPTLSSDTPNITVPEGPAVPTMAGNYNDTDGDTVALSASSGTVVRTSGTSTGRWTWTGRASDEGTQTITITANDGHGHSPTASFTVTVTAVKPTLSVNGPTSLPEGSSASYTGTATTPDASDQAAGFSYGWYVTKNGETYEPAGSSSTFTFSPDDDGAYVLTFEATDDGGVSNEMQYHVTGTNVAPTATITGTTNTIPIVLATGENVTFNGAFSDPGVKDTHSATWTWGDGQTSAAQDLGQGGTGSFSAEHSWATTGTFTVTLTVTDDDGGQGTATRTITVMTTQQALDAIADYIKGVGGLNPGQKQSLLAKLGAAKDSFARGDVQACSNQLNALLNELRADANTGKLATGDAIDLSKAVYAVKGSLGTYNRFLEWWPLGI